VQCELELFLLDQSSEERLFGQLAAVRVFFGWFGAFPHVFHEPAQVLDICPLKVLAQRMLSLPIGRYHHLAEIGEVLAFYVGGHSLALAAVALESLLEAVAL
jgi:hypothetical protein